MVVIGKVLLSWDATKLHPGNDVADGSEIKIKWKKKRRRW
jgi:hypothetical protein